MSLEAIRLIRSKIEEHHATTLAEIDAIIASETPSTPEAPAVRTLQPGENLWSLAADSGGPRIFELPAGFEQDATDVDLSFPTLIRAVAGGGFTPLLKLHRMIQHAPVEMYGLALYSKNADGTVVELGPSSVIHSCGISGPARRGIDCRNNTGTIYATSVRDIKHSNDAQAIWFGTGAKNIVVDKCYLEASGEVILLGGADRLTADGCPENIMVKNSTLTRPVAWRENNAWIGVKNIFEVKDGVDVTLLNCHLANNWKDDQDGFAVLLTVVNQGGRSPHAKIERVIIKGNTIEHTGSVFQISGRDAQGLPSGVMSDVLIEENMISEVDPWTWGGKGQIFEISRGPDNLRILGNHISGRHINTFLAFEQGVCTRMQVSRNTFPEGTYGIHSPEFSLGRATWEGYTDINRVWAENRVVRTDANNRIPYPAVGTEIVAG